MNMIKTITLGGCVLICCSCSWFSKKAPEVAEQGVSDLAEQNLYKNIPEKTADIAKVDSSRIAYRKNELTFQIKGDGQLNKFQNNAHALYVCIYQLKDPNAFNQQAEENLGKLLECTRFDSSVANSKRIVVQPGQEINEIRDRAEGARFIGLATGYYGAEKVRSTQLQPIPLVKGGSNGIKISIELGPNEIETVTVK
jgi:type VI secretion system VasD/TssJ family lipoprotein